MVSTSSMTFVLLLILSPVMATPPPALSGFVHPGHVAFYSFRGFCNGYYVTPLCFRVCLEASDFSFFFAWRLVIDICIQDFRFSILCFGWPCLLLLVFFSFLWFFWRGWRFLMFCLGDLFSLALFVWGIWSPHRFFSWPFCSVLFHSKAPLGWVCLIMFLTGHGFSLQGTPCIFLSECVPCRVRVAGRQAV